MEGMIRSRVGLQSWNFSFPISSGMPSKGHSFGITIEDGWIENGIFCFLALTDAWAQSWYCGDLFPLHESPCVVIRLEVISLERHPQLFWCPDLRLSELTRDILPQLHVHSQWILVPILPTGHCAVNLPKENPDRLDGFLPRLSRIIRSVFDFCIFWLAGGVYCLPPAPAALISPQVAET